MMAVALSAVVEDYEREHLPAVNCFAGAIDWLFICDLAFDGGR
jgi:hypothetical protein